MNRGYFSQKHDLVYLCIDRADPRRISIGATRKAGTGGVNGSGIIARVKFKALAPGETEIRIARNDDFALHREYGTYVDGSEEIIIKAAKVIIE